MSWDLTCWEHSGEVVKNLMRLTHGTHRKGGIRNQSNRILQSVACAGYSSMFSLCLSWYFHRHHSHSGHSMHRPWFELVAEEILVMNCDTDHHNQVIWWPHSSLSTLVWPEQCKSKQSTTVRLDQSHCFHRWYKAQKIREVWQSVTEWIQSIIDSNSAANKTSLFVKVNQNSDRENVKLSSVRSEK